MQNHPFTLILISALLLISCYRNNRIFSFIAIIYPILSICRMLLWQKSGMETGHVFNLNFVIDYNFNNQLISFALLIVTLAANLYAIAVKSKLEIIFGSLYCAFSNLSLFAGDFISLFIGLESMVIFTSILLLLKNDRKSLQATKRYFITHLFSGSLILIGISHIIIANNSTNIIPLADYLQTDNKTIFAIYSLLLTAFLINIAAFPFSGWMINCYPAASNSSFIYLLSFTTKINLIILIKLFSGLAILKVLGLILIVTALVYACKERNFKRLLCYLSLCSYGLILIGTSIGAEHLLYQYLFIDILYKALIALIIITLDDHGIRLASDLPRISFYKFPVIFILCLIVSGSMLFCLPFLTATAYIKHYISENIRDHYTHYIITLSNLWIIFAISSLVNKNILRIAGPEKLKITLSSLSSLYILVLFIILTNLILLAAHYNSTDNLYMFIQLSGCLSSIVVAYFIKPARINTTKYNFDLLRICYIMFNYLNISMPDITTPLKEGIISDTITLKFAKFHSQRLAIFIVFCLLISLILILNVA